MSIKTWESHLASRGRPLISGEWPDLRSGKATPWAFYGYDQEVPDDPSTRTAMCVPVRLPDLLIPRPQIVLTINKKRGGLEIPGGHRDPLAGGGLEPPRRAAGREVLEETGIEIEDSDRLIATGYTEIRNDPNGPFPPIARMQFYGVLTDKMPRKLPDEEVDGAGIFTPDQLYERVVDDGATNAMVTRSGAVEGETLAEDGIRRSELTIALFSARALLRHYGLPYEYITMP